MPNKQSCRNCGAHLSPLSECPICKEHILWICIRCEKMDDVTHTHCCLEVASSASRLTRNDNIVK